LNFSKVHPSSVGAASVWSTVYIGSPVLWLRLKPSSMTNERSASSARHRTFNIRIQHSASNIQHSTSSAFDIWQVVNRSTSQSVGRKIEKLTSMKCAIKVG